MADRECPLPATRYVAAARIKTIAGPSRRALPDQTGLLIEHCFIVEVRQDRKAQENLQARRWGCEGLPKGLSGHRRDHQRHDAECREEPSRIHLDSPLPSGRPFWSPSLLVCQS